MTTKTDGPVYRALTSFAHGYSLITEGTRTRSPQGPAKFWTVDDGDDATFTDAQAALAEDVRQAAENRAQAKTPQEYEQGMMRCTRRFEVTPGIYAEVGDLLVGTHPTVHSAPANFEPVTED